MNEKVRRNLFLTSGILGVVLASIDIILEVLSFIVLMEYGIYQGAAITGIIIGIALCVAIIVMSVKLIKNPTFDAKNPKSMAFHIVYLVLVFIMFILICGALGISVGINILVFLCALAVLPIHIVAMVLKNKEVPASEEKAENDEKSQETENLE